MRIIIFDVAAEKGGALTILQQYYDRAVNDLSKEWIFILSKPIFKEKNHIKIINYPWIKKSWLHRLYFDYFIAYKIVNKYLPDKLISLQNIIVPKVNIPQTVYVHQSLPFISIKIKIHENFKLWIYQNIIGKKIKRAIKRAESVIVQTKWMLDSCSKATECPRTKFVLEPPVMSVDVESYFSVSKRDELIFFYPAGSAVYKNHRVVVDALLKITSYSLKNTKIIFTLTGNESREIRKLRNIALLNGLPLIFAGKLPIKQVYEYYTKSILLFPSYVESFGLPLLEAKEHKCPIIASDTLFSREILGNYKKAYFFNPFSSTELSEIIERVINLESK